MLWKRSIHSGVRLEDPSLDVCVFLKPFARGYFSSFSSTHSYSKQHPVNVWGWAVHGLFCSKFSTLLHIFGERILTCEIRTTVKHRCHPRCKRSGNNMTKNLNRKVTPNTSASTFLLTCTIIGSACPCHCDI